MRIAGLSRTLRGLEYSVGENIIQLRCYFVIKVFVMRLILK